MIKIGDTLYNTGYTAHLVRPNFGYAEISFMLKMLDEIAMIHG